jgi:phage terminase Nu1 subunit (DNA packaging protein)
MPDDLPNAAYTPLTEAETKEYLSAYPTMTNAQRDYWRVRMQLNNAYHLARTIRWILTQPANVRQGFANSVGHQEWTASILDELRSELQAKQAEVADLKSQLEERPRKKTWRWPMAWGRG